MEHYYTVDKIAKMLSMHPKTIQRYIREEKLRAAKIGKSWQVSEQDLKAFMERSGISNDIPVKEFYKVTASSVIDITAADANEAFNIEKYLMAAMNSKPDETDHSVIHTQYLECEHKLRVTLWGSVPFMQSIFEMLSVVIKNMEREI